MSQLGQGLIHSRKWEEDVNKIVRLAVSILVVLLSVGSLISYGAESASENLSSEKLMPKDEIEDNRENIDWDKMDKALYEKWKSDGGTDEAQFHKAVGFAFLTEYNRAELAEKHFLKAVELNPKDAWALNAMGMIYIDTDEGNAYFKKAIEANPDYPLPYYWLAYTYCRFKKDKEALPIWEQYLKVAKGQDDEKDRIQVAEGVLEELHSGKDGKYLKMIRMPE